MKLFILLLFSISFSSSYAQSSLEKDLCRQFPEKCPAQASSPEERKHFDAHFKSLATELVDKAIARGWTRVGRYTLAEIRNRIQTSKVSLNPPNLILKMERRETALYFCDRNVVNVNADHWKEVKKLSAKEAAQGSMYKFLENAMALHELIGASMGCGIDNEFQISMSIDLMSEENYYPNSPYENKTAAEEDAVIQVAGGRGGTTGVGGGGDALDYIAKKAFYLILKADIEAYEKEEKVKFKPIILEMFLNMNIEFYRYEKADQDFSVKFDPKTSKFGFFVGSNKFKKAVADEAISIKILVAIDENAKSHRKPGCTKKRILDQLVLCY